MQNNTTDDGQTDRRTYLKTIGAGALATGMVAIAGCLGAEAENTGGSNSNSGSTPDAGGGSDGSDSESTSCDALKSEFTAYDTAGTPFVCGFDYPRDWTVSQNAYNILIGSNGDDALEIVRFDIMQWPPSDIDDPDEWFESAIQQSGYQKVATLDFAGETVPVVGGWHDTTIYRYSLFLPYDVSGGKRGYAVLEFGVTTETEKPFEGCKATAIALSKQTVKSLRPNPDSTIEEM